MLEVDKIIRAWKDEDYRLSLSNEELSGLPENPAGLVELSDADLKGAPLAATWMSCIIRCPI